MKTGNITGANILTGGVVSATGNITGNNISVNNNFSVSGNAVITGNLTVNGATEFINVTNLAIKDPIIDIGRGTNNAPLTSDDGKDRGEQLWYYSGSEKSGFIGYDNSAGKMISAVDVTITNEVVTVNSYGNFVTGNLEASTVSLSGNVTSNNVSVGNIVSAGGNITGANILTAGNVSATSNVIGNNINAGNIISAGGNITGANLLTGGNVSATGNIDANNINTSNIVSATGNVKTSGFFVGDGGYITNVSVAAGSYIVNGTSNVHLDNNGNLHVDIAGSTDRLLVTSTGIEANSTISAVGNINGANLLTAGQVSATGNVTGNFILGNGYYLTGLNVGTQDKIANGNSNVYIPTANGDVTITASGNANIVVVTGTGANITGYANVSGNLSAGNITYTGELSTAGNINFTGANAYFSNVANIKIPGGTANYVLTTDGAGNLSWQVTGSGNGNANVAGTNTQVQFNDAGSLGASANFTFDKVTETLSVTNISTAGNAVIAGNLTVSGTTEYINVTNLAIKDPIISIGRGTNNAPLTSDDGKDRGEQLWYYSGSEKSGFIGYDNSAGKIIAATDVTISSEVVTVSTYGNFVVGGLEAATVSASGNVNGANILTGGLISATGNVDANNFVAGNIISAVGNITGNYILGNGAFLTGIATGTPANISNGTSNINIPVADGNVNTSVGGAANVFVVTTTGANITGTANVSGNLSANNISSINIISAGANITGANLNTGNNISAAGTITANNANIGNVLSVGGNVTGANLLTGGIVSATGNITGNNISATGNLSATSGIYGTIQTASQPNITSLGTLTGLTVGPNSSVILSGNTGYVRANSIQGRDGSQAIYMYYGNVSGAVATVSDLTVGAGGSGNLVIANGAANISGNINFSGANAYFANVSNLKIPGGSLGYFLKTDGSGNLSWDQASATPGGLSTELQFNDSGIFNGTTGLTYDDANSRMSITNYSLVAQNLGGISGAQNINVTSGCYVKCTITGITNFSFLSTGILANNAAGFVLEITNGGLYTTDFPPSVRWPGGSVPELTASGVDVLVFITSDAGTTWRGAAAMINSL